MIYNAYILLSSVIYSLSKIVILHGMLEKSLYNKVLSDIGVSCPNHKKAIILVFNAEACPDVFHVLNLGT